MAMAVFSPYKANEGGVACPRDVSFSSYLDPTERDFGRSLAESINTSSPAREIFAPRKSVGRNLSQARRSGELDVFRADRYFNEKIKDSDPLPRKGGSQGSTCHRRHYRREKRDDLLERKSSRSNVINTTSSSSLKSEGSFNSQIGLLLTKKGCIGHKIFSGFQCKGSCFDKKSVSTSNTHHMVQSSSNSSHQQHFASPIIDIAPLSLGHDHQYSSKSMDNFGFHQLGKQETAQNLDKKDSILAWNTTPNSPIVTTPFPFPLKKETSSCNVRDEDQCSDTSSDLFEIENLTGVPGIQTSTPPYYEPSQESIEWSVVTASAADSFSDIPDHHEDDDHKTAITIERRKV